MQETWQRRFDRTEAPAALDFERKRLTSFDQALSVVLEGGLSLGPVQQ